MSFGVKQLVDSLNVAIEQRDAAQAIYNERSALERDNLHTLRRLRADPLADPVELNNAKIRATAYERSVRTLWNSLQDKQRQVQQAEQAIKKQRELLGVLRNNLAHAERNVVQFNVDGQVTALERQIADIRRKHKVLVDSRDMQQSHIETLTAELETYAAGVV